MTGKVILTGTGCGDIGLMTCKAADCVRGCDTLVYDHLIPEEVLKLAGADCEKIYVGKVPGHHSYTQEKINEILIEKAREGKTVVRLKGGDPYVFGRGGEEFLALRAAHIPCETVSGVSSAIAVPAAAGIPVTHRGLCRGVTILTATTASQGGGSLPRLDYEALARLNTTLVILMGMQSLDEIARRLIGAGMNPGTPAAVIMEGTTRRQKAVRSCLESIAKRARMCGLQAPAVIVIGAVAALNLSGEGTPEEETEHPCRISRERGRLAGVTIGLTGTDSFAERVRKAVLLEGAKTADRSFLTVSAADAPLPAFDGYDWLVFTSPNGARVFLEKLRREKRDLRGLYGKKIAVIGPGTGRVLKEAGLYADYMPDVYDSAHLANGLTDLYEKEGNKPALFLRAREGSAEPAKVFQRRRLAWTDFPLYSITEDREKKDVLQHGPVDFLVFGSARGVRTYFEAGLYQEREAGTCVCIGEQCAKELSQQGVRNMLIASKASVSGLVECMACEVQRREGKEYVQIPETEEG